MDHSSAQAPLVTAPSDPAIPAPPGRLWTFALTAGVAAGLVAWLCGEAIGGVFGPAEETYEMLASGKMDAIIVTGMRREATLAFAILGGLLGLALGLAGGLTRRSLRAAAIAAAGGLALGAFVGAGVSFAVLPSAFASRERLSDELAFPMIIHGAIWSAVGASGGLAFGLGLGGPGRIGRGALGGLLGAALATVLYEVLGALAFPLAQTGRPISIDWPTRLIARLAVTVLAAAGAALLVQEPARPPRSPLSSDLPAPPAA